MIFAVVEGLFVVEKHFYIKFIKTSIIFDYLCYFINGG